MQSGFIAFNNAQPFMGTSIISGPGSGSSVGFTAAKQINGRNGLASDSFFSTKLRDAAGRALNGTTALSTAGDTNVFNARVAVSSNEDAVTATAANGAAFASYDIAVYQLAAGQSMVSDKLDIVDKMTGSNAAGGGIFAFKVNINDTEHRIEVNTIQSDTNETLVNKIADAINKADIGLNATVNYNYPAQTVQLSVAGFQPGDVHSFSMTDDGGRNLLKSIGVSTAHEAVGTKGGLQQAASNAVFSVNGEFFTSSTNTVALYDNSLEFTFKKRTDPTTNSQVYNDYFNNGGELPNVLGQSSLGGGGLTGSYKATLGLTGATGGVTVEVMPDTGKAAVGISNFVESTSEMANVLGQSMQSSFQSLSSYLMSQFGNNKSELSQMGIEPGGNGYRVSNNAKLNDKLQNDFSSVRNFFSGPAGLAQKALFGIERAAFAPFAGISYVQTNQPGIFGITGFFHDSFM